MARLKFDVLDLFRASQGIKRDDGYAVIPQDIAEKMEEEFERLYAIEEHVIGFIHINERGFAQPTLTTDEVGKLADLCGVENPYT